MAMMISKFNKLIHNKTVWLIFAIFISVAFVMVYTGGKSDTGAKEAKKAANEVVGRLWGKDVTAAEYGNAYRNTYVMYSMMVGRPLSMNDEIEEAVRTRAWQRLATLKKAEEMGLTVTNEQTVQMIKSQPIFQNQQTGQYDANMYNMFVQGFLPSAGMTAKGFEQMMAENVLIEKAAASAAQGALVTDDEIKKAFHLYNDLVTAHYAFLPRSLVGTVEVTQDDAKAYYEQNPDEFRLPKKRIVHYVAYEVDDYTNSVSVTDEQVAQVYEQNLQRYIKPETATNEVPEYIPLEEVKGEIVDILTRGLAQQAASRAADELVAALADESTTFEAEAEKAGKTIVKNTPAFAQTDRPRGIDPTAPFAQAAFTRELTPSRYYSDVIAGRDTVYVLAYQKELPDFLPAFEVVEADATASARIAAAEKAYIEKTEEIHEDLVESVKGGATFADAASKFNLDVQTTEPFSISSPLEDQFSREIMGATIQLDKGTVTDLISTPDEFIIAYVAEREAADEEQTLPGMRDQLAAGIRQEKAARLAQAWQESLLDEAGFEEVNTKDETAESAES